MALGRLTTEDAVTPSPPGGAAALLPGIRVKGVWDDDAAGTVLEALLDELLAGGGIAGVNVLGALDAEGMAGVNITGTLEGATVAGAEAEDNAGAGGAAWEEGVA